MGHCHLSKRGVFASSSFNQPLISALCPRLWWISSTQAWGTWSISGKAMRNQLQVNTVYILLTLGTHLQDKSRWPIRLQNVNSELGLAVSTVCWRVSRLSLQQWLWLERPILKQSQRLERMPWFHQSPESSVSFMPVWVTSADSTLLKSQGGGSAWDFCTSISVLSEPPVWHFGKYICSCSCRKSHEKSDTSLKWVGL